MATQIEIKDEENLIGKFWFNAHGGLLFKFPKEIHENSKLPIKIERSMAVVLKKDCIEIRNLIPK